MTKPATITSPTHAFVLGVYTMIVVLGALHLFDFAAHDAVTTLLGDRGTTLWITAHIGGGVSALVGVLIAARQKIPRGALRAELIGMVITLVVFAFYGYSLSKVYGGTAPVTTITLAWTIALSALARMFQIRSDLALIRRTLKTRVYADPPPLADPHDIG